MVVILIQQLRQITSSFAFSASALTSTLSSYTFLDLLLRQLIENENQSGYLGIRVHSE